MSDEALPSAIPAQHGHIARMIGSLRTAHAEGTSWDAFALILDSVLSTVQRHFEHEEREMTQVGYPQRDVHRAAHETFLKRLRVLRDECERRETELMGMLVELLHSWFKDHERTADADMLDFLRTNAKRD